MPGLEGTTLGHYQLLGRLGRGGMSEVYLAYDDQENRNVALKVVSSSHTDYLERFHREADAIRRLHHDHILPAFGYGDQEPWHYLVMPFVEHGTLRDVLDIGALTMQHADELLQQIAGALQSAHDNGIIHRDIKPSNILMRDKHYIYLADFGLAKELEGASSITQTGALLGTPEYMAPDLADGPATTSSDVYALGVMLYQMVTGRVPFSGETPVSVYMKHLREQPMPPSFYNPKLSRSVDQVILHALEKDPRRRFQTPQELADAFHRAVTTPSVHDTQEMSLSALPSTHESFRSGDTPLPATRRYGRQARQARQARQNRTPSSPNRRFLIPEHRAASTPSTTHASTKTASPVITDPLPTTRTISTQHTEPVAQSGLRSVQSTVPSFRPGSAHGTQRTKTHRSNRALLALSIIIIGIVLFVILPMAFVYYNYVTHPHPLPVRPTPVPTHMTAPTSIPTLQPTTTPASQGLRQPSTSVSYIALVKSGTPVIVVRIIHPSQNNLQKSPHSFDFT